MTRERFYDPILAIVLGFFISLRSVTFFKLFS